MLGFGSLGQFSLGEYLFVADPLPLVVPAGGTSSAAGDNDRRHIDPRKRRGLVPPPRRAPELAPRPRPQLPLPPFTARPVARADERSPIDLVNPDLLPDVLGVQNEIFAAQESYRRQLAQIEQDQRDIADVIAFLESSSF